MRFTNRKHRHAHALFGDRFGGVDFQTQSIAPNAECVVEFARRNSNVVNLSF